jgi:general secretion pathway protein E
LVRTLDESREAYTASSLERSALNIEPSAPPTTLYRPNPNTAGFRGRTGIYELVMVDDTLRGLIHDGASEAELEAHARSLTPSIREDGRIKVLRGETTLDEVLRVTRED